MIGYRASEPGDAAEIGAVATQAYVETFEGLYRQGDLDAFLPAAFGPAGLQAHVSDPSYTIRVATDRDTIIGFAKLGPVMFPGDWPADAVELHQLYVLKDHLGAGVGPALMDWAIATARGRGAGQLVLSVYVDNHRAKRFYARYGFVDIGRYDFAVGSTIDEDRLMRLML
ncbi:Acetyltransferase (GNAT) family protein [Sphingomonas gellani]|uniref:Acetyltransferase (GNAT) family protein n=1 Tax=Sphingomonas gellani TaxID=1166340 RepID=A0A1H8CDW2_9SPHN|nr:GNAT family N-acetyltransferase [Sphingomonas gellani]SEM92297.1 Acetyltransferase (GNAT) family protein [Sphingomonas gellani]